MKWHFFALGVVFSCMVSRSWAQLDPIFSNYSQIPLFFNPSGAIGQDFIQASMIYRNSWSAPETSLKTSYFSLSVPVVYNRIGLGIQIKNENISIYNQLEINGLVAYKILLHKGNIAFGMGFGFDQVTLTQNELKPRHPDDPLIDVNGLSSLKPDLSAGITYTHPLFFIGLSAKHMLNLKNKEADLSHKIRHIYLNGGSALKLNGNFVLHPSVLIKYAFGMAYQVDVGATLHYKEKIWTGANWRSNRTLGFLAGFSFSSFFTNWGHDLKLGYALDWNHGDVSGLSPVSHEWFLGTTFGKHKSPDQILKERKHLSPAFL